MQIPSRPILRLLRRPNGARISPPSRSFLSSMACGPPRGWLPTLARRVASVRAALNPPVRHVSRFPHGSRNLGVSSGVEGEELRKPDRRRLIPSAKDPIHTAKDIMVSVDKHFRITRCMEKEENRAAINEFIDRYGDGHPASVKEDGSQIVDVIYGDEDARRAVQDVIALCSDNSPRDSEKEGARNARGQSAIDVSDSEERQAEIANIYEYGYPCDGVARSIIFAESRHQDGSIYRDNCHWKQEYRIADRNETRLEAMMLSDPSRDCIMKSGKCISHEPCPMFQILSVKLAKLRVDSGSVELYGYIAARDLVDPLLNYVVNISRDDPIIVEQGSLIEMSGPKRGIELSRTVLLEYDMRIKTGDQEKDDLPLVDGVSAINEVTTLPVPFTKRIHGNYGAVDMTQMCVEGGVEATVEVFISEVQSSFNLCLSCFTSGLHEEIRLFDGVIGESRDLRRRHVLATVMGTCMDLKVKVGSESDCSVEHCRSFKATNHGYVSEQIKIEFASILVKVTWSTLDLQMLKLL